VILSLQHFTCGSGGGVGEITAAAAAAPPTAKLPWLKIETDWSDLIPPLEFLN